MHWRPAGNCGQIQGWVWPSLKAVVPQLLHKPPAFPCQPTTPPTHPVSSAKVDSLCKVVALVEATVVSTREGNDEFSCTLVCADNLRKKKAKVTEIGFPESGETWFKSRILKETKEKGEPEGTVWQQILSSSNSKKKGPLALALKVEIYVASNRKIWVKSRKCTYQNISTFLLLYKI